MSFQYARRTAWGPAEVDELGELVGDRALEGEVSGARAADEPQATSAMLAMTTAPAAAARRTILTSANIGIQCSHYSQIYSVVFHGTVFTLLLRVRGATQDLLATLVVVSCGQRVEGDYRVRVRSAGAHFRPQPRSPP